MCSCNQSPLAQTLSVPVKLVQPFGDLAWVVILTIHDVSFKSDFWFECLMLSILECLMLSILVFQSLHSTIEHICSNASFWNQHKTNWLIFHFQGIILVSMSNKSSVCLLSQVRETQKITRKVRHHPAYIRITYLIHVYYLVSYKCTMQWWITHQYDCLEVCWSVDYVLHVTLCVLVHKVNILIH